MVGHIQTRFEIYGSESTSKLNLGIVYLGFFSAENMSTIDWINDELAKVMIASREGWGITRHGRVSCNVIKWTFDYDNCKFDPTGLRTYCVHPLLRDASTIPILKRAHPSRLELVNRLKKYLVDKYETPGNPIIIQEIRFPPRIKSDSVEFHPKDGYRHPHYPNHTVTWPNGNFSEIPYIYDATHFAKGFRLSKKGSSEELIYDDIRFHQHGCTRGYRTTRIDEIFTPGVGGQQGNIEDFIEVIEKTIEERGKNSRILVFERDSKLLLDAWTSEADFEVNWNDFLRYLRFSVVEFEHKIIDGVVMPNIPSEYIPHGPPEAHFCCYMFTPVEEKVP